MVNIRGKSGSDSPRVEVWEIDTRAPFQSIRDAVSLFEEVVSKGKPAIRRAKSSSENLLDKETQLLLVQTEINKIRKNLERDESTKGKALGELDKAKKTVQELTSKLNKALESKDSAAEATEAVRNKAAHLEGAKSQNEAGIAAWKKELTTTREQYKEAVADLDAAKQQLTKIQQDFDVAKAQRLAKINSERASSLSDQIRMMRSSLEHLKATSGQAHIEQSKIVEEKEKRLQAYKISKEEVERKIASVKGEVLDHEEVKALESRLAETTEGIVAIREVLKRVRTSDMDSVKAIMIKLDDATMALQKAANEDNSHQDFITSLRKELENVRKERASLEEREREIDLYRVTE